MKKTALAVVFLFCLSPAFSQAPFFDSRVAKKSIVVGLRGGVNFNTFGPDINKVWDFETKQKSHTGWNIGLVFDCPILESLHFVPGAFYKTRGFRFTASNHAYDRQISGDAKWLQFPLLFSYRFPIKKGIQLEVNAGPYIACGLNGTVTDVVYSYLMSGGEEGDPDFGWIKPDYVDTKNPIVTSRSFFGDNLDDSFGIRRMDYGLSLGVGVTINRFYIGFQYDLGLTNMRNYVCWAETTKFRNGSATILVGFNFNKH